jgi:hypothetical protein
VADALRITQEHVSLGSVQRGEPGRREAMPYFFSVLRDLVAHDPHRRKGAAPRQRPHAA